MGQHFGELAKVRGIVIHKISPFEQKAFAGVISKGVPNTFRRFSSQVFRVAPRKFAKSDL
jgi:ubiquinol-cytochrome c reductase subunit 8